LPHWTDGNEKRLACLIHENDHKALYLVFNASTEAVDFSLPAMPKGTRWYLAADTSLEAPDDLFDPGHEPILDHPRQYHLNARSSAILLACGRT
jgi:glycogen operon protein